MPGESAENASACRVSKVTKRRIEAVENRNCLTRAEQDVSIIIARYCIRLSWVCLLLALLILFKKA